MDLLLHIGLGKTGTTTLQEQHFVHVPGYLGRPELFGHRKRGARLHLAYRAAEEGREVDMGVWRANILDRFHAAGEGLPEQVIISQERLAAWSVDGSGLTPITGRMADGRRAARRAPHPFAGFIARHVIPAWESFGNVRVLLTVRNQPDWLSSHYAQVSNRIINASQVDFERQVRWILDSGDAYLDFAALVEAFEEVVGHDHVSVLLLEDIATAGYWDALSSLVGARLPKADSVEQRANRRSTDEGWALRPYNRAKYPLRVTLVGQEPTPDHRSMWTLRGLRSPANVARTVLRRRDVSIRPNDELRAEIRAHFRASNSRLEARLGRDLRPLGY